MPGHYGDTPKKKKKKPGMPNHVGLVQKLGQRAGKTGTGKQMLLDMMKKNMKKRK
tara:strand:+ start:1188 stop:1352 length:165 start_codon:yes stop_codon:yes gene_type:complete